MRFLFYLVVAFFFTAVSGQDNRVVVYELFTSQGCSSCPSADRLMTKIDEEMGDKAIVLAYHVDYWDRLGWKDLFGSPKNSSRQREYDEQIPNSGVYTPQVVVNGVLQGVGSNESFVRKSFREMSSLHSNLTPDIDLKKEGDKYLLKIENKLPDKVHAVIAIVEDKLDVSIKRGENAGKSYVYNNVVRQFSTLNELPSGFFEIQLNKEVEITNASVVVFFQNSESGQILGAIEIPIKV